MAVAGEAGEVWEAVLAGLPKAVPDGISGEAAGFAAGGAESFSVGDAEEVGGLGEKVVVVWGHGGWEIWVQRESWAMAS